VNSVPFTLEHPVCVHCKDQPLVAVVEWSYSPTCYWTQQ